MKNAFAIFALAALASASAAADVAGYSIEGLKLTSRQPWDDTVEISFTVNPPAGGTTATAIELDVVASNGTDEVYISDNAISSRMAAPRGAQKLIWQPSTDHAGCTYGNLRVYVSVKAEVTEHPAYMFVNLNDGSIGYGGASSSNALRRILFFREFMAFRYIPPTTSDEWKALSGGDDFFWFGTDEHDAGYTYKNDSDIAREDRRHRVKLTKGMYYGVYPMTRGQLGMLGVKGFCSTDNASWAAVGLSYEQVRGADTVGGYNMPASNEVAPDSIVGKMRALTGLTFDLPTNFQWEYAARAGSTNVYLFTESGAPPMTLIESCFKEINPHMRPCNAWGIYGVIGCCHQWTTTLGRTSASSTASNWYLLTEDATDPTGPAATYDHPYRISRGSHFQASGITTTREGATVDIRRRVYRIAYKYPMLTNNPAEQNCCGARLCLTLDD